MTPAEVMSETNKLVAAKELVWSVAKLNPLNTPGEIFDKATLEASIMLIEDVIEKLSGESTTARVVPKRPASSAVKTRFATPTSLNVLNMASGEKQSGTSDQHQRDVAGGLLALSKRNTGGNSEQKELVREYRRRQAARTPAGKVAKPATVQLDEANQKVGNLPWPVNEESDGSSPEDYDLLPGAEDEGPL